MMKRSECLHIPGAFLWWGRGFRFLGLTFLLVGGILTEYDYACVATCVYEPLLPNDTYGHSYKKIKFLGGKNNDES